MASATTSNRSPPSSTRSTAASTCSTPPTCMARTLNEELVGKAIKGRREQAFIATKFGIVRDPKRSDQARRQRPPGLCARVLRGQPASDWASKPSTCITSTASTRTCRSRKPSARWPSWWQCGQGALSRPVRSLRRDMERACKVHPIAALQSEFSLWTRDPQTNGMLDACRKLGVSLVAYSPLGRGFLTGAITFAGGLRRRRLPPQQPALPGRQLQAATSSWSIR
jgi:hypothetical protein